MALFGDYESAGSGIAKNAPKKKPFFRYWELVFRKFWKLLEVNVLMMLSLLPLVLGAVVIVKLTEVNITLTFILLGLLAVIFVVCFGPIMAACTQILRNFVREKPCFMMDTFFKTFRSSFKQSVVLGLIDLLVASSAASSFYVYPRMIEQQMGFYVYILFIATLSVAIAVLMMSFYGYLMIVSTDLSLKNILKNSLALSILALKKNLITLGLTALVMGIFVVLTILFPYIMLGFWLFVPVAFVAFMIVFNCYPVIQQYIIDPYYAQRGEVSPEAAYTDTDGQNLFEDQGGKEAPIEPKKKGKKGKIVS